MTPNLSIHLETNWCVAFVIHLPAKKPTEDCSFQEAFSVAIVDEIAAKETLQVQQKQTLQQANEVSKDSSFSPLHVLSVTHRDKELVKIRCLQARRWHTLVFFCGSGGHARPITNSNFEKVYFAAAMYVLLHIARVCEKRRVNTFTVEDSELLEESSSCIRLFRIRMAWPRQKSLFQERSA